ncbi:YtfJ family protein [Sulfurimonas sp.]
MKLKMLAVALLATINLYAININEKPKEVSISGENGSLVKDGGEWNSKMLQGKVYVIFYVDPDKKDVNEEFVQALKAKDYRKRGDYGSIAIVNMAATWKPDFAINILLKAKQKEFPETIYVKDKKKVLVKEWGLKDDASDILIFSKNGTLLFYKAGKMSSKDTQKAFDIIEANL